MAYLIALIPALGWGFMPIITGKIGGSSANQIFGIGAGASIIGILAFLVMHPHVSATAFIFSLVCGALWSTGQVGQFESFKRMGVSKTIPLSTVFQLVGNSIIGVLFLGQWSGSKALMIGFVALLIVVVGALLTSVSDEAEGSQKVTVGNFLFLLVTTIGYWVYSTFPNLPQVKHEDPVGVFLPEMLGILVGAAIYSTFTTKGASWKQAENYKNILGGLSWGIAAFAYIFAARQLGSNTAFIFTQLNVIIATFGGILLLHEHKSAKEMKFTVGGIALIVIGSICTIFA